MGIVNRRCYFGIDCLQCDCCCMRIFVFGKGVGWWVEVSVLDVVTHLNGLNYVRDFDVGRLCEWLSGLGLLVEWVWVIG